MNLLIRGLTLAASLCLLAGLWIPAKAWLAQRLLDQAWAETDAGLGPEKPWPWADTWPVARLTLPRQKLSLVVLEGVSGQSLAFGPGHLEASAAPGTEGTIIIAGHRDTFFRSLANIRKGDPIDLQAPLKGAVHYRVVSMQVVDSRKTKLDLTAASQGADRLMLVTCYPFDAVMPGGPLRYVVTAVRNGASAAIDGAVREAQSVRHHSPPDQGGAHGTVSRT